MPYGYYCKKLVKREHTMALCTGSDTLALVNFCGKGPVYGRF